MSNAVTRTINQITSHFADPAVAADVLNRLRPSADGSRFGGSTAKASKLVAQLAHRKQPLGATGCLQQLIAGEQPL